RRKLLCVKGCSLRWLVGRDAVKESGGRGEEKTPGDRRAEVEGAIVITGRAANEHVFKHFFDGTGGGAVAGGIGAELSMARVAEGHVVAKDFDFLTVFFDDCKGVVGGRGLHGLIEFDVGYFCATDNSFLGFGGELVPGIEIVKILLDDDVAS